MRTTRHWRWLVVVAGLLVLCAAPAVVASLPTAGVHSSADSLLRAIQHSEAVPYSGYAEATGSLALPVTTQFTSLGDLFGGKTSMRVWSRGASQWRVDTITAAGERDVHVDGTESWTWDYEPHTAVVANLSASPAVRLPVDSDLLPTTLARRLLSEANADEVTPLRARRVAGRSVPGLRMRPTQPANTIDRVDVWALPESGIALRVEVHALGSTVLSTRFLDLSLNTPALPTIAFTAPTGAQVRSQTDPDLVALINRIGRGSPPPTLAGYARNVSLGGNGAVGIYGRGITEFTAIPLFGRIADSLRSQLSRTYGATANEFGQAVAIGPISVVLTREVAVGTDPDGDIGTSWLLSGLVAPAVLAAAADSLVAGVG